MTLDPKRLIFISALVALLTSNALSQVFTAGGQFVPQSTTLNAFNFDGSLIGQTETPGIPTSLTVTNGEILAAVGENILRYDLDGSFQGTLATLPNGGQGPMVPTIESDLSGNLYFAFGGNLAADGTSFRLNQAGEVTQTFSHPDLVSPGAIDAGPDGTTYILQENGALADVVFAFDEQGNLASATPLMETVNPAGLAISESLNEMYVTDEFGGSIHVYDLSSGAPVFSNSIAAPDSPIGIYVDQTTNRIFATSSFTDPGIPFGGSYGYEIERDGTILNRYEFDNQQLLGAADIVAFVPEPSGWGLALIGGLLVLTRRRPTFSLGK